MKERKVIYSQMVSLDGFIEDEQGGILWSKPDEVLLSFISEQEHQIDTHLYGRRTYENMASYWPFILDSPIASEEEKRWARNWLECEKLVFSRVQEIELNWNSRYVKQELEEEIKELKCRAGGHLSLGGAGLAKTFMDINLVDEFHLYVYPILLGKGKRLFPSLNQIKKLKLVDMKRFDSGVLFLNYHLI
ncbi:dihydrofolate reductase family protein [Alkalihalobacillus sp. 1P02AB]|uniref:dihydrofolate reductase family protein n=1 Tax=Alkalihalobacillus sp. 1P02AB TaxID=3132260 RepID=UPI0039A5C46C